MRAGFFSFTIAMPEKDITANYHGGHPNSVSAHAVTRTKAQADRERILALILKAGPRGMTCDEVEQATGLKHQTASARLSQMVHDLGTLRWSGEKRLTRSGTPANVHVLNNPKVQTTLF